MCGGVCVGVCGRSVGVCVWEGVCACGVSEGMGEVDQFVCVW